MVCINKKYYFDDSIHALSQQALYWKDRSERWEHDAHSFYDDILKFQIFINRKDIEKEDIKHYINDYVNSLSN